MGVRRYEFSVPLSKDKCFDLLILAGQKLPESSDLAGMQFGRWENSKADRDEGELEWKMYDHKMVTISLGASLSEADEGQTQIQFSVYRKGQIFDPVGLYKQNLRLLLDPFVELVKGENLSPQSDP